MFWDYPLACLKAQTSSFVLSMTFVGLDKTCNQSQGSGYSAYLQDILIYSKTEKEHLEMLDNAFKCLQKSVSK